MEGVELEVYLVVERELGEHGNVFSPFDEKEQLLFH